MSGRRSQGGWGGAEEGWRGDGAGEGLGVARAAVLGDVSDLLRRRCGPRSGRVQSLACSEPNVSTRTGMLVGMGAYPGDGGRTGHMCGLLGSVETPCVGRGAGLDGRREWQQANEGESDVNANAATRKFWM